MNDNMEIIRDGMAGAVVGALLSVLIFLLSLVNATLHLVGGLFTGNASFDAMQGGTFAAVIFCLMLLGACAGCALGYLATMDTTIKKNCQKWMRKHNH